MVITQEILERYFSDPSNLFLLWTQNDSLLLNKDYMTLDYLSIFISLTGTIEFESDFKTNTSEPYHVQLFNVEKPLRITKVSEDYSSVGLIFSRQYWNDSLLHAHPYLSLAIFYPNLKISEAQLELLLKFYHYISDRKKEGLEDDDPIIFNLILGMFFNIGRFYESWARSNPVDSGNNVVSQFASLLFENYRQKREVAFYAERLHLSKSRFSAIIKKQTGVTAYQCIEKYVLFKSCAQLKNTQKSVKEISIDLNFSDSSHFCKFFRKNMGMSPEEYRNRSRSM